MLWIVKLTVTPLLVGLVSLAARQWGPTVGGLLMALPWMTGPILFFIAMERGTDFAAEMAVGVELGAASIGAWTLAFASLARRTAWPVCLAAAIAAYAGAGLALGQIDVSLTVAAGLAYIALLGSFFVIPRPKEIDGPRMLPWWDIPVRMAATAVLVAVIIFTSGMLGPQYSGIAATYPVIATVMAAFTQYRWGPPAAIRLLRAMLLALVSFTTFFLVVGWALEPAGIVVAFSLAILAALATSAVFIAMTRKGILKN